MNLRLPALILLSAAFHVLVIWAVAADRPPVLLLARGEICVDCLPSPAAEPRPLVTKADKEPVKDPKPEKVIAPPPPKVPEKKPEPQPTPTPPTKPAENPPPPVLQKPLEKPREEEKKPAEPAVKPKP